MIFKIRLLPILISIFLLLSCVTYQDPYMQQKNIYLQARQHFNDMMIQLNAVIKMQSTEDKIKLKADFRPLIDTIVLTLDSWGLVVKQKKLNDSAERQKYQTAKAQFLAELSKYLTE